MRRVGFHGRLRGGRRLCDSRRSDVSPRTRRSEARPRSRYGFLGIRPVNLQRQEILAGLQGIRVEGITPGTPAAHHGLRPDDIITVVNGVPIHDADALVLEVGRLPVESVAHLGILRSGRNRVLDVVLASIRSPARRSSRCGLTLGAAYGLIIRRPSSKTIGPCVRGCRRGRGGPRYGGGCGHAGTAAA